MKSALFTASGRSTKFTEHSGRRVYPLPPWMQLADNRPRFIQCYLSSDFKSSRSILAVEDELSDWRDE